MYPSFEIFGRTIGSYGVCAVIAIFVCVTLAYFLIRGKDFLFDDVMVVAIFIGVGGIIGAKIVYAITQWQLWVHLFTHLSKVNFQLLWQYMLAIFGGQVFYGGFIGGTIALTIYFRTKLAKGVDPKKVLDVYAIMVPLFHFFGRIGCFLGGCCYGIESNFGFVARQNEFVPELVGVRRFPTPLLESACNLCIFAVILVLFLKKVNQGKLLYIYMLVYPIVRFSDEFLRGDEVRGHLLGLSTSQWISIGLFVYAIIRLVMLRNQKFSYEQHVKNKVED